MDETIYPNLPWVLLLRGWNEVEVPPIPIKLIASMSTSWEPLVWKRSSTFSVPSIPDTTSTSFIVSSSPLSTRSNKRPRLGPGLRTPVDESWTKAFGKVGAGLPMEPKSKSVGMVLWGGVGDAGRFEEGWINDGPEMNEWHIMTLCRPSPVS